MVYKIVIPCMVDVFNVLSNWVIYGQLLYWLQEFLLPEGIIKSIRSIIYRFVWNERRDVGWKIMARSMKEGGLGLWNPKILNTAEGIQRVIRLWSSDESIWMHWIRLRYMKGDSLLEIQKEKGDSYIWRAILDIRCFIPPIASCDTNYGYNCNILPMLEA